MSEASESIEQIPVTAVSILGATCIDALAMLAEDKSHHAEDLFVNPWNSHLHAQWGDRAKVFNAEMTHVDMTPPQGLPPVCEPDWAAMRLATAPNTSRITWFGHASCLIQLDGFNVLVDPLFTYRASPITWAGPARYTQLPPETLRLDSLPQIHLVLLSHDHYDHTSAPTIRFLISNERLLALRASLKHHSTSETRVFPTPPPEPSYERSTSIFSCPFPPSSTAAAHAAALRSASTSSSAVASNQFVAPLLSPAVTGLSTEPLYQQPHAPGAPTPTAGSSFDSAKSPVAESLSPLERTELLNELAPHFVVPLRMRGQLLAMGVPATHIHEADWWETRVFELYTPVAKPVPLPTVAEASVPDQDSSSAESQPVDLLATTMKFSADMIGSLLHSVSQSLPSTSRPPQTLHSNVPATAPTSARDRLVEGVSSLSISVGAEQPDLTGAAPINEVHDVAHDPLSIDVIENDTASQPSTQQTPRQLAPFGFASPPRSLAGRRMQSAYTLSSHPAQPPIVTSVPVSARSKAVVAAAAAVSFPAPVISASVPDVVPPPPSAEQEVNAEPTTDDNSEEALLARLFPLPHSQSIVPTPPAPPTDQRPVATLVIVCTPAQHNSGRLLTEKNTTAWASYAICGPTQRVFFAGATGLRSVPRGAVLAGQFGEEAEEAELTTLRDLKLPHCPAFSQIGETLGPFDVALLPIGSYSPRWLMSPYHLNPLDAVLVHQYVRARRSIGYAWGTFKMGDEPIWEPVERLARELKRARLPELAFTTLKHGETAEFDTSTAPRVQSSGFSK